jgi:regulator of cell morphogenesis and NO signaling
MEMKNRITFKEWPLDLLMDYILKIHHRGIRKNGPQLLELIGKVRDLHSQNH